MNTPFLTIAIPTYKRPNRLNDLLQVIAKQKMVNNEEWEVLISDNHSCDTTASIVESYAQVIPNLVYVQQAENIGPDRNIWFLFQKARGEFVWLMPDDDNFADLMSVREVIDELNHAPLKPAFAIVNASAVELDTGIVIRERLHPVEHNVFFFDGRDILSVLSDIDLITGLRLIIRKDTINIEFSKNYYETSLLTPLAVSIGSCAAGSAMIIGKSFAKLGLGDQSVWRSYWSKLCLQDMPDLLLDARDTLGYSSEIIKNIIEGRKQIEINKNINPIKLSFQLYGLSWRKLSRLYGRKYITLLVLKNFIKLFYYIPYRAEKEIVKYLRRKIHK